MSPKVIPPALLRTLVPLLVAAAALAGCDPEPPSSARSPDPLRWRPSDEEDLGRATYQRYCAGCHGKNGDGKGLAAKFLFPTPRDFTGAKAPGSAEAAPVKFKFTTTPANSLPTDDDILRTIERGLRGTAMPDFPLLSRSEKLALVETIKSFSPRWKEEIVPSAISLPANPFDLEPGSGERERAIRLGEEIYHAKATCWTCHPVYVSGERKAEISRANGNMNLDRPNPDQPVLKDDSWGQQIPPPDFRTMPLKSVGSLGDIYRVIAAGVGGTAMPTWDGALEPEKLWAMAIYVQSLVEEGRRIVDAASGIAPSPAGAAK